MIQLLSRRSGAPIGDQLEPIALVARKHVHVDVKDLLERGLAIRQEEVDPLAADAGRPDRSSGAQAKSPVIVHR